MKTNYIHIEFSEDHINVVPINLRCLQLAAGSNLNIMEEGGGLFLLREKQTCSDPLAPYDVNAHMSICDSIENIFKEHVGLTPPLPQSYLDDFSQLAKLGDVISIYKTKDITIYYRLTHQQRVEGELISKYHKHFPKWGE